MTCILTHTVTYLLVCRVGDVDVFLSDVTSSDDEFEHRLVESLVLLDV